MNQQTNQSTSKSINQPIKQPIHQQINQSINQSSNKSINQSTNRCSIQRSSHKPRPLQGASSIPPWPSGARLASSQGGLWHRLASGGRGQVGTSDRPGSLHTWTEEGGGNVGGSKGGVASGSTCPLGTQETHPPLRAPQEIPLPKITFQGGSSAATGGGWWLLRAMIKDMDGPSDLPEGQEMLRVGP